ncbi:hypothetical protein [Streptomyces sp. NPDC020681]|uniref:hypothetical protein n=1 Tax=Streptomyces sp. NPDC020681 TaxID=3365083 RepID=UPI003791B690
MSEEVAVFPAELKPARRGRVALEEFTRLRDVSEPITVEGWIAQALVAVDAYARDLGSPCFRVQAEQDMADALSLLGDVATDVLHFMDGRVQAGMLANGASDIADGGAWDRPANRCAGIPEFPDVVAFLAALSCGCAAMWGGETTACELVESALSRFGMEAEDARWGRIQYLRDEWLADRL